MSSVTHNDERENGLPKNEKELEKYGVWVKSGPKDISADTPADVTGEIAHEDGVPEQMPDFSFLDSEENIAFDNTGDETAKHTDSAVSLEYTEDDMNFSLPEEDISFAEQIEDLNEDEFSIDDLQLDDLDLNSDNTDEKLDIDEISFPNEHLFDEADEKKLDIDSSVFAENSLQKPEDEFNEEPTVNDEKSFDDILNLPSDEFDHVTLELDEPDFSDSTEKNPEIFESEQTTDVSGENESGQFDEISLTEDSSIFENLTASTEVFDDENLDVNPLHEIIDAEGPTKSASCVDENEKSILEKIASELSMLHSEFSSLKKEIESLKQAGFADMREKKEEATAAESEMNRDVQLSPNEEQNKSDEAAADFNSEIGMEKPESVSTETEPVSGFFSGDMEDEAIALSGDELNNILANADFTEEAEGTENASVEESAEEVSEEVYNKANETLEEAPAEAKTVDSEAVQPESEIQEETGIDESVFEPDILPKLAFEDEQLEEPELDNLEIPRVEEDISEDIQIDLTDDIFVDSDAEDTSGEMPVLQQPYIAEENVVEAADRTFDDEESAAEPAIIEEDFNTLAEAEEKAEEDGEFAVESAEFTDSENGAIIDSDETAPEGIETEDKIPIEDALDDNMQTEEPLFPQAVNPEDIFQDAEQEVPSVNQDEETFDEPFGEEIVLSPEFGPEKSEEETDTEAPKTEGLSEENISYLKEEEPFNQVDEMGEEEEEQDLPTEAVFHSDQWNEEPNAVPETPAEESGLLNNATSFAEKAALSAQQDNENVPKDLKYEIKSVLSYMDQLLENLPEDKIAEFAQSEHFETYKKLFKELGLS